MKVGIIHYRAGKTDGVSLEIAKRKSILENLGHTVKIISGPVNTDSDYVIPELEFELPEIQQIKTNSFAFFNDSELDEESLMQKIRQVSGTIENQFYAIHKKEKFDLLLVHNIFSHGRHLAAASAFAAVIKNLRIPCLATNHDYYWERAEYQTPRFLSIEKYLEEFVPVKADLITYISINSIAAKGLEKRSGIKSEVFPDIFDFDQPEWEKDPFNSDLPVRLGMRDNDFLILQATRVVPRKAIESAVYFTEKLAQIKDRLIGKKIYNGKELNADSRIILLIAGYAEKSSSDYLKKIKELTKGRVDAIFAADIIDAERIDGPTKTYSLWDAYVFADLVTYPSLSEGWGNQFIEAVFARKPIILFEYPVFNTDIAREGYFYVSLGQNVASIDKNGLIVLPEKAIARAVDKTVEVLAADETEILLDKNFEIGRKFHGFLVLKDFLDRFISKI